MERINLRIHPLFLAFGVIACLVKELSLFLIFTFSALLHELAHAYTAARYGYQLNEIHLLPFGAVVKGDLTEVRKKEELLIYLSGPFFSGMVALFTLGVWWLFPDCYPYTEDIFTANRVLCLSNLLPIYPLDGGRIILLLFRKLLGKKRGNVIAKIFGGVCAVSLSAFYCWMGNVVSCLFYAALLFGLFGGGEYKKISFTHRNALCRGVEERRVAVDKNADVKKLLRFISADRYLFVDVYTEEGEYLFSCRQEEIEELFYKEGIYAKVGRLYPKKEK